MVSSSRRNPVGSLLARSLVIILTVVQTSVTVYPSPPNYIPPQQLTSDYKQSFN
jgi:hypothetical protein